ncbi:MAG: hypothetical protein ACT4NU_02150 [Chromatiales bacterium]
MELHRVGVKFFAEESAPIALLEFIPIFHRWIQTRALEDLLIDVVDYSHVWTGPGIVLVAHEGNYGYDETGNRRGLVYYSKHTMPGQLPERLATVCRKALKACRLLEQEPETRGQLVFRGDEVQVFSNDRLVAPNSDATYAELEPGMRALLGRLYPDGAYSLTREADMKERFCVTAKAPKRVGVADLLERLAD